MSNFTAKTRHPETGEWLEATWVDNFFGQHKYGVLFPMIDGGKFLTEDEVEIINE